jgi:DNA polymerase III subunit delta
MKEISQLMLDLRRRIFKPVYFLSGEETYYIDLVSDFIEQNALEENEREFNQDVVYGKDVDLPTVLALAKQFPMMSDYKVVIVKEAQNLKELAKSTGDDEGEREKDKSKTSPTAAALAQFTAYVQNPLASTILVFCYKYKTIDKRSAAAKALQKNAVFIETKKMYDNQVPEWIGNYIKEKGYVIGPKSTFLLSEFIGNDLSRITNEIEKLVIGLEKGAEITPALVQDKIGISREYNVFELQDALGTKDVMKANRIVTHFAANEKEHPLVVITATLFNYFTKIYRYQSLTDKSKFAAAQAMGVNPYFVEGYARAAGNYPPVKMRQIFNHLKECDLKSKGIDNASIEGGELLKELVYKILH